MAFFALVVVGALLGLEAPGEVAAAERAPSGPSSPVGLAVPFPCGVRVWVTSAYHARGHYAHDRYAVDLVRAEVGGGRDKVVVPAAGGVVRYAGWAPGRWAYYGQLVLIEHDFSDSEGEHYQTLYAHLNSVAVDVGQRVDESTALGTMGGSSRGRLGHLGSHLHFALYRGAPGFLGRGVAVRPEPLAGRRSLRRGMTLRACQPVDASVSAALPRPMTGHRGRSSRPSNAFP